MGDVVARGIGIDLEGRLVEREVVVLNISSIHLLIVGKLKLDRGIRDIDPEILVEANLLIIILVIFSIIIFCKIEPSVKLTVIATLQLGHQFPNQLRRHLRLLLLFL